MKKLLKYFLWAIAVLIAGIFGFCIGGALVFFFVCYEIPLLWGILGFAGLMIVIFLLLLITG